MGVGDAELFDPGSVSDTLKCPVCMDMFEDPVFCGGRPCQHVFCRECVEQALERSEQCPACRAPMRARDLQPHQVIRSLLDEVVVRCEHLCGWVGRRDARAAHTAVCPIVLLETAKAELAAHCERHSAVDEKMEERDRRIQELEALVAEKDKTVVRTGHDILELKVHLSKLEGQVANPALSELVKQVAQLSRKLDECEGQLATRDARLQDANRRCEELERRLEERDLQLAVFRSMTQASGSEGEGHNSSISSARVGARDSPSAAHNLVTPQSASNAWVTAAAAMAAELEDTLEETSQQNVERADSSSSWPTFSAAMVADLGMTADLGSTAELEENCWEDPEGFSSLPATARQSLPDLQDDTMEDPCL